MFQHVKISAIGMLCLIHTVRADDFEKLTNKIQDVQIQIQDLTNPLELLQSKTFIKLRTDLTTNEAVAIIQSIKSGAMRPESAIIGLHVVSKFSDAQYWDLTSDLLTTNTPNPVLLAVLYQKFPFGSTYANAHTNSATIKQLGALKRADSVATEVKVVIQNILDGTLARAYRDYRKRPKDFGY
jgi:hypothetical protein